MARKKTAGALSAKFSREKLLKLERYKKRRDLMSALLAEGETYTLAEADALLEKFLKGKVK